MDTRCAKNKLQTDSGKTYAQMQHAVCRAAQTTNVVLVGFYLCCWSSACTGVEQIDVKVYLLVSYFNYNINDGV